MTLRALLWVAVSSKKQASDDKESLAAQERDLRAAAEKLGYQVVDVLRVPGFSRRYSSLEEFAAAAAEAGIDAGQKLIYYLDHPRYRKAHFDVFMVRDGDRFGRSQRLFSAVAEGILIDLNLPIYAQGRLIDNHDAARSWIALGGLMASSEVDKMVERHRMGMQGRFDRGYPNARLPFSHRGIRNAAGKLVFCEVKPELLPLWHDLVTVLCDGIAWDKVGAALFEQYGHRRPNGRLWSGSQLRHLVFNPIFWGHSAKGFNSRRGQLTGLWSFDPSVPPPPEVQMKYDVFPAVLHGETAERLKNELRRRAAVVFGAARPRSSNPFSGLLVCGGCGYRMCHTASENYSYYRCDTRLRIQRGIERTPCISGQRGISEKKIRDWFHARLSQMLETHNPRGLLAPAKHVNIDNTDALKAEIAEIENQAARLMLQMTATPPELQPTLQKLIDDAAFKLRGLRESVRRIELELHRGQARQAGVERAFEQIQTLAALETFWVLPVHEIHQHLFNLLGGNVLVCLNGEIVGVKTARSHNLRKHKTDT